MKRIILLHTLLFTVVAHAILDTNNNGLSDLWEKQYNNGNLFPNTFFPTADSDIDGWNNRTEAAAGTDPFWANPPEGIVANTLLPSATAGAYTLTWPTRIGKRYQLQASTDMESWLSVGNPIIAENTSHSIGINVTEAGSPTPPKLFWHVLIDDIDSDSDGLTNNEEHQLGTNPNAPDSDGDTLNDKAEILANLNPLSNDSDEDGLADNLDVTPLLNNAIADPDGENLPAPLNYTSANGGKLIARYDFESLPSGPSGGFPSSISGIPAASATDVGWDIFENPSGMPSFTCRWNPNPVINEYLALPYQIADDHNKQVWAYWLKLPANSFVPSPTNTGIRTLLAIGINRFAPTYPGTSSPLPALHWYCDIASGKIKLESYQIQSNVGTPITLLQNNDWNIPSTWNDGLWHHVVLHKNDNKYNFYFDGSALGERTSNNIYTPLTSSSYTQIGRRDQTYATLSDPAFRFPANSRLDRLRCYTQLTATDVLALYNQDIDRDGLYDRTEARYRLWQDRNHNTLRDANESDYTLRPFHHDSTTSDHDRDGITSHDEQNGPIISDPGNFDSDGDLLPDGWEKLHNFPYHLPNGTAQTHLDSDLDGADNLKEYLAGTNPLDKDSDDDTVEDGIEINQNGRPTDPADQGLPPDPANTYALDLAIGDQSGSKSERYEMVVYEYDWTTHTETKVFTLGAEGYGDFKQDVISGFDPLSTYTFQILWKGTKLGYNAQADFDYTFRVDPADPNSLTSVSEIFDPETGTFESGSILGQKNNITNFLISTEPKRVIAETLYTDFAVDTDMDGKIESLSRLRGNVYVPDLSKQDRDFLANDPQRAVIIDINNNNTDSKTASSGKDTVDNTDNKLDSQADKTEITDGTSGHSFGHIRLWCWPSDELGIPWKGNQTAKYKIKLSYADPTQANFVRVFGPDDVATDNSKPEMYLGPGKTAHYIDPAAFFTTTPFEKPTLQTAYRNLVAEGITCGTATIKMEVIRIADNVVMDNSQEVRLCVNVDQFAQAQTQVPTTKAAISLRGNKPHYFGAENPNAGGSRGLRAVRGRFIARLPSIKEGIKEDTQISSMHKNFLRELNPSSSSGASFWMGIKSEVNGQLQWAQCGLRWLHNPNDKFGGAPQAYLETGLRLNSNAETFIDRFSAIPSPDDGTTDGNTQTNKSPLKNWYQGPLDISYILFKNPVTQNNGVDSTVVPWVCLIKDNRANPPSGVGYIRLECGFPGPKNVPSSALVPYRNAFNAQNMGHLELMFETNQSVAFAPGKLESDEKGQISQVMVGHGLINDPNGAMPTATELPELWTWLNANIAWEEMPDIQNPGVKFKDISQIRDGTNVNGNAKAGTSPHPYWQKSIEANGMKVWDMRNYGYGATYSN